MTNFFAENQFSWFTIRQAEPTKGREVQSEMGENAGIWAYGGESCSRDGCKMTGHRWAANPRGRYVNLRQSRPSVETARRDQDRHYLAPMMAVVHSATCRKCTTMLAMAGNARPAATRQTDCQSVAPLTGPASPPCLAGDRWPSGLDLATPPDPPPPFTEAAGPIRVGIVSNPLPRVHGRLSFILFVIE